MSASSPSDDSSSAEKPVTDSEGVVKPVSELTPEEQMEKFAEQLKEDDWGHQPC